MELHEGPEDNPSDRLPETAVEKKQEMCFHHSADIRVLQAKYLNMSNIAKYI